MFPISRLAQLLRPAPPLKAKPARHRPIVMVDQVAEDYGALRRLLQAYQAERDAIHDRVSSTSGMVLCRADAAQLAHMDRTIHHANEAMRRLGITEVRDHG